MAGQLLGGPGSAGLVVAKSCVLGLNSATRPQLSGQVNISININIRDHGHNADEAKDWLEFLPWEPAFSSSRPVDPWIDREKGWVEAPAGTAIEAYRSWSMKAYRKKAIDSE